MTHRAWRRASRALGALFTCLALALTPGSPARASQSAIAIAPSEGHPLERTVVAGSGFAPGEQVRLSFDSQAFGKIEADRRGSFLYRRRVPSGARPGPATIFA